MTNKELNQRASVLEEWIKQDGADDVLKALALAFASIATQSTGAGAEHCYKMITLLVQALDMEVECLKN